MAIKIKEVNQIQWVDDERKLTIAMNSCTSDLA